MKEFLIFIMSVLTMFASYWICSDGRRLRDETRFSR